MDSILKLIYGYKIYDFLHEYIIAVPNWMSALTNCLQLFSQLVNWFMFFCITRTLSNSLETVLTVAGLHYWFAAIQSSKGTSVVSKHQSASKQSHPSRKLALLIAALSCAIRPTSAVTWLYVGLLDFIQMKSKCRFVFLEVIPVG